MTEPRVLNLKFRFDTGEEVFGVNFDISPAMRDSLSEDQLVGIAAEELRKFLRYLKEKENVRRNS